VVVPGYWVEAIAVLPLGVQSLLGYAMTASAFGSFYCRRNDDLGTLPSFPFSSTAGRPGLCFDSLHERCLIHRRTKARRYVVRKYRPGMFDK